MFSLRINPIKEIKKEKQKGVITNKMEKILTTEEKKKLVSEEREIIKHIERNHARIKSNKLCIEDVKEEKGWRSGFVAFNTALVYGITGVMRKLYKDNQLKEARTDEVNNELTGFMEGVKADLSSKYPLNTDGMTASNFSDRLSDAFSSCYTTVRSSFGHKQVVIKDGWENFYIDYKNHAFNGIKDTISGAMNNFDHYSFLDAFKDMAPVGLVTAGICSAIVFGPAIVHKIENRHMEKTIQKEEARRKEIAQILDENAKVEQQVNEKRL